MILSVCDTLSPMLIMGFGTKYRFMDKVKALLPAASNRMSATQPFQGFERADSSGKTEGKRENDLSYVIFMQKSFSYADPHEEMYRHRRLISENRNSIVLTGSPVLVDERKMWRGLMKLHKFVCRHYFRVLRDSEVFDLHDINQSLVFYEFEPSQVQKTAFKVLHSRLENFIFRRKIRGFYTLSDHMYSLVPSNI